MVAFRNKTGIFYFLCYFECILGRLPDYGGNRTRDLWDTSPMLCQLSYEAKSVRVCGTKSKSGTFDTNVFYDHDIFVCVLMLCTQVNIMFLMLL